MKVFPRFILLAAALCSPALAEEPLTLTVHPSGVDRLSDEAKARDEQLRRRMEKAEFLLRNICVRCGERANRPGSTAPVNPTDALSARR
jgi:hypothetical protein